MPRFVPKDVRVEDFNKVGGESSSKAGTAVPPSSKPGQFHATDLSPKEYSRQKCVQHLFEEQVELTPDAKAVVFENRHLTYRELNERANQLARHLRLRGIGPDALVGICLEPSLELPVAIFGVLKAGGAYLPLDPGYPPERIAYMLEKARVPLLIHAGPQADKFGAPGGMEVVRMDADWPAIATQYSGNLAPLATPENLIYLIFTSGSTGQPKGAAIRHSGFSNLLHWFVNDFGISEKDRVLVTSSVSFDLTQKNFYAVLLRGGTLHLCPPGPYDAGLIARLIDEHRITLLNCTPSAFYPLAELNGDNGFPTLASLRIVFLGGEAISLPRVRPWLNHPACQAEIVNTYGPTECTDICAFHRLTRENLDDFESVPLGKAISRVQLVVVDDSFSPCPPGAAGELCVGGAGVGAGYLNDPETTAAKFVSNPFSFIEGKQLYRTGDRVRMLANGNIEFVGRVDHQVKIRGFRIELGEIDAALDSHPDIQSAVVIAREDKAGEKFLAAYFVPRRQPAPAVSELRAFLQAKLPNHMVPTVFITLESFPLNPNGKLDRGALRDMPLPEKPGTPGVPANELERQILAIWLDVLPGARVGLNDNFFDLGGDSIRLAQVHARLQKFLGRSFPITDLFAHTTIQDLAEVLSPKKQRSRERKPELIQLQAGHSGPEVFFLIDEGSLGLFKLAHFMGKEMRIYASMVPLPPAALKASAENQPSALPLMEELAADHLALIMRHKPDGPVVLAGHCFGGMLGFEVAHRLRRAGREVEAVLMLDTWMTNPSWWWRKKTWCQAHGRKLLQQGPEYVWQKFRRRVELKKGETALQFDPVNFADFGAQVPWSIIARIYSHAMLNYQPQVLRSRGICFISEDDWQSNAYRLKDDTLGAGRVFSGGTSVFNVPGDHVTVLNETHLPELARRFGKALEMLRS